MGNCDNMRLKNENFAYVLDWLVRHKKVDGQKGLAHLTGISANTISRIMTGKVEPSDDTLRKLADTFGLNMQFLRGIDTNPHHILADNHEEGEGSLLQDAPTDAPDVSPSNEMGNVLELYARMIRGVDDLRVQLKDALSDAIEVKGELQQARDDFRDATYRLNLLIEKIQNKSDDPSNIGIAADN